MIPYKYHHFSLIIQLFSKLPRNMLIHYETENSKVIKQSLFLNYDYFVKVKNMVIEFKLLFRVLIGCMIPREGNTDQISWDHKHFIWFLVNMEKINLSAYIFNHMCEVIKESIKHNKNNVSYVSYPNFVRVRKIFHQHSQPEVIGHKLYLRVSQP